MFYIHCYTASAVDGFPENTYTTSNPDLVQECVRDVLENGHSGIARIVIEDSKNCLPLLTMSPHNLD
jgi:hypothetical protein